jgi:hypothetical protein
VPDDRVNQRVFQLFVKGEMVMKKEEYKKTEPAGASPATHSDIVEQLMIDRKMEGAVSARCARISNTVDLLLRRACSLKQNQLKPCKDHEGGGCACGDGDSGSSGSGLVDLIVLIDTSGSMTGSASAVSDAASEAIKEAEKKCDKNDLRVLFLGVDGTWPGTVFNQSHRDYLAPLTSATLATDSPVGGLDSEEGANAIEDLSKFADWRKGACRAIFYISDEELDSLFPLGDTANEAAATAAAIAAANSNSVTVFAHHLTYQNRGSSVIANYNDLCNLTGGKAFFSATANKDEYVKLLSEVICSACGNKCKEVEFPDIHPCVSISWGDSECDCIETDDVETLCVTVCNCYTNVTLSDLTIGAIFVTTDDDKSVPALPDGTPSVQVIPLGPICFGDIPPCVDGEAGCVSRQFTLRTRGAKSGLYKVRVAAICYSVTYHYDADECFVMELCKD